MIFRRLLMLSLLILAGYIATAQNSQMLDLPKVIPPSPNAAALGKFGDIPLGSYTGLPSVGISLYTMTVGKFSLPISLNYHSGGLKVEEIASSVGLGWSLNAGGVITRSMHGLPDESSFGYWNYYNLTKESIASNLLTTKAVCGGVYDKQPDIFYYNFGGQSGKFILDSTALHNARFIPFVNLKVTHDNVLNSFSVTDANGIIYIFNVKETTTTDAGSSLSNFTSAWYLATIITPAGNVSFEYSAESTSQVQVSESHYLNIGPSNCNLSSPGMTASTVENDITTLRLKSITSPFEKIDFLSIPNRRDMPQSSMISGMTVKSINGSLIKKFSFVQSYFGNTNSTHFTDVRLK